MARSQSPIVIEPPRLSPVTGSPIGEALQGFGQSMLQFFMMKQQMELEERKLAIMEQEAKLREKEAQRKAGEDEAKAAAFATQAQSDPQMAGAIPGMVAPQPQVGQQLLQALAAGQADPNMFNAQARAPVQVPGMQDVSSFMGGQPAFAPNQAMAGALQPMMDVREQQSRISLQNAQAVAARAGAAESDARAEQLTEETTQMRKLFDTRQRLMEAEAALKAAQAAGIPREIAVAERQVSVAERQAETAARRASAEVSTQLRTSFANLTAALGGDVATSSRVVFGTDKPPSQDVLMQWADELIGLDRAFATQEDWEQHVETRRRTVFAEGLNIQAPDHETLDGLLAQAENDPQQALQLLADMTRGRAEQPLAIGQAIAYYNLLFPDAKIKSPITDKSFLQAMRDALLRSRATITGAMVGAGAGALVGGGVGSIPGAAVGGILGATGGLGQDLLRENSSRTTR